MLKLSVKGNCYEARLDDSNIIININYNMMLLGLVQMLHSLTACSKVKKI